MRKHTVKLEGDTSLFPFVAITDSPIKAANAFCVYHYDALSYAETNILLVRETSTEKTTKVSVNIKLDINII